jgi:hypothetical protein
MSCKCKEKEPTPTEALKKEMDSTLMSHARTLGSLTNQISKIMARLDKMDRDKK